MVIDLGHRCSPIDCKARVLENRTISNNRRQDASSRHLVHSASRWMTKIDPRTEENDYDDENW